MGIESLLPMGISLIASAAKAGAGGGGGNQPPPPPAPSFPTQQPFMTNHPLTSPNSGMQSPSMLDPFGQTQGTPSLSPMGNSFDQRSLLDLLRGGM